MGFGGLIQFEEPVVEERRVVSKEVMVPTNQYCLKQWIQVGELEVAAPFTHSGPQAGQMILENDYKNEYQNSAVESMSLDGEHSYYVGSGKYRLRNEIF